MKGMREKYRNDHYLHLHRNFKGNLILGNYYSTDSFRNNTTTYSVLMYPDVKLNNLSFTNMFQIQPESLFYLNDWIESNRGIDVSVSLNCSSHSRKNCYLLNRFRPFSFLFWFFFGDFDLWPLTTKQLFDFGLELCNDLQNCFHANVIYFRPLFKKTFFNNQSFSYINAGGLFTPRGRLRFFLYIKQQCTLVS